MCYKCENDTFEFEHICDICFNNIEKYCSDPECRFPNKPIDVKYDSEYCEECIRINRNEEDYARCKICGCCVSYTCEPVLCEVCNDIICEKCQKKKRIHIIDMKCSKC